MTTQQIILIISAGFPLVIKGTHLIAAIKEKNKDQIKVHLFFFSLILIIGLSLFFFLENNNF